jgi:hypothetical protein
MMKNKLGLIFCVFLGGALTLILFVESKRPIYVDFTVTEITEELCRDYAESNDKEKKNNEEQATHPKVSESYD